MRRGGGRRDDGGYGGGGELSNTAITHPAVSKLLQIINLQDMIEETVPTPGVVAVAMAIMPGIIMVSSLFNLNHHFTRPQIILSLPPLNHPQPKQKRYLQTITEAVVEEATIGGTTMEEEVGEVVVDTTTGMVDTEVAGIIMVRSAFKK